MAQEEEELNGKAKLVYEASLKYFNGKKMMEEGKLELASLLGEHTKGKVKKTKPAGELTSGQKSALTKKKKLIAHRESSFKKDKRSDEVIKEKMIALVKKNRQVSTALFQKKLKLSERRTQKCLGMLVAEGKLEDRSDGTGDTARKWMFPDTPVRSWSKKKPKGINGHKLAKTPGGGGKRRGSFIDVTQPELVNKAISLMNTDDWVTKGKLIEKIDLSPGVTNRLLTHMKKEKLVKEVIKKHNPAHKDSPKNFERPAVYYTPA